MLYNIVIVSGRWEQQQICTVDGTIDITGAEIAKVTTGNVLTPPMHSAGHTLDTKPLK